MMQSPNYNPETPIVVANVCPEAHELLQPVLDQWFGDAHHAIAINESSDSAELIRGVTRGSGKWKKSVRCVSAVFDQRVSMGIPSCLPSDHQRVTFVGDPFRLAVAEYQRQLQQPNFWHRGQQIEFSKRFPSLDSFLQRYPDWLYGRLPQDLTLANLSQKFNQEYLFVGLLGSLQESVNQLAQIIGQPTVELSGVWDAGGSATGSEQLRQKFYAQYPRLKAIYDVAGRVGESLSHASHNTPPPHRSIKTGSLDFQKSSPD